MKRLESRACRAGVTEEMGGTVAGRRACVAWLSALAGEGRVVVLEGGEGWWRIENTSHRNGRRHRPHLKLIQSGRDTQTEGQERFALAMAEAMGGGVGWWSGPVN